MPRAAQLDDLCNIDISFDRARTFDDLKVRYIGLESLDCLIYRGSETATPPVHSGNGFVGFAMPNVTIVIDGQSYYPSTVGYGPVPIVLSDGIFANLTSDFVENGATRISIPPFANLVSGSSATIGSWGVTFSQRQFEATTCSG